MKRMSRCQHALYHLGVLESGQTVKLGPGDLLVVDNQKLHHVVDHPRLDTRVIVVSFLPELVYSLGSSSHGYAFL